VLAQLALMSFLDFSLNGRSVATEEYRNIRGGNFEGCNGWFCHSTKKRGTDYYYVLVDLGNDRGYPTYVKMEHIKISGVTPENFVAAIFDQHPSIEGEMDRLCSKLAMCGLR